MAPHGLKRAEGGGRRFDPASITASGNPRQAPFFQRSAASLSLARASTQRASPASVSSTFQNGASVFR